MKMDYGLIRTSSVLIASGDCHAVYASVHDVPERLRQRLEASTTGRNSGTIVIADRRGKEEIEKAARFQRISQAPLRSPSRVLLESHLACFDRAHHRGCGSLAGLPRPLVKR